jgi:hypothetical protein
MNRFNLVILEGNACRDAEVKNTNSGALIGNMKHRTELIRSKRKTNRKNHFIERRCNEKKRSGV